jgi:hypothetical protein
MSKHVSKKKKFIILNSSNSPSCDWTVGIEITDSCCFFYSTGNLVHNSSVTAYVRLQPRRHNTEGHNRYFRHRQILKSQMCVTQCVRRYNTHFLAPGKSCMTHRQALTSTAATVIHTGVQPPRTSCVKYRLLMCVCVDIAPVSVAQHAFLYESHLKCNSAKKCRMKFRHKFPRATVPNTTSIH